MENPLLDAAIKYLSMGISVFPVNPLTKKPVIESWKKYQTEYPTKDELNQWFGNGKSNGIAIVTGKLSNLFVVDFDKYKPGFSEEKAIELIPDTITCPIAKTIRGGQHFYFRYPTGHDITIRSEIATAIDYRGEGGYVVAPPTRNMIGSAYEWQVTLDACAPPALPESFIKYINKDTNNIYARGGDRNNEHLSTLSTDVYIEGHRDDDIFHIAHLLVKAGCEERYLYKTLEILALNCNPPFPLREAEAKIKSAIDRANRKERNLAGDVRDYILSTSGSFLSTDIAKCLHLSTREDLKNLSIILKRLEKTEKLIVKSGNKNGCYRTIDQEEEVIDYQNADVTPYEMRFPLGIHEWVNIHPGNVVIVAGESNAGKSAFCLNVAKMNSYTGPVNYMSSEMQDGAEPRIRLIKFGEHLDNWKNIKFTFRTDNYPDKIDPDGLNIIDYLDEGTDAEAYKMPMRIRNIADKLKRGVVVIALQKDPNKGLGFGGSGTMNRSRLYLTMTKQGIIKIEKAKMWRNDNINPNGMFCNFKLVGGAKFIKEGDWKQ